MRAVPRADAASPAILIRPLRPFDLRLTALVLERTPSGPLDRWDETRGEYRRLLPEGLATVRQSGSVLRVRGVASARARTALARLLGVDVDAGAHARELARDTRLAPLVDALPGLKPQRFPTVWEALCNAVACQQVSLASGLAALGRFGARHGRQAGDLVALPPPEAVAEADLSGLGMSGQKQAFLRGLARAALDGALDGLDATPSEAACERLLELRGVGRWTAEYVLLRGLGRLDVFPADDVGAARALARLFGATRLSPQEVREQAVRWGDYRGLVFFYLLGWRRALGLRPLGAS